MSDERSTVTDEMVEVARAASMHQLLLDSGVELRFDQSVAQQLRCPLHGDGVDEKGFGSARLYPDSNRVKCWGCDKIYDTIEWVKSFHRVSFPEAVEFLCREYSNLDVDQKHVKKVDIEGKAIIDMFEGDFRHLFDKMTDKERGALSQTLDRLWAVGCSVESQKKMEEIFNRVRTRGIA